MKSYPYAENSKVIIGRWRKFESSYQDSWRDQNAGGCDYMKFLNQQLSSVSPLRRNLYRLKYNLILDPIKQFMLNVTVGFFCNVFLMMSCVLVFERVSPPLLIFVALPIIAHLLGMHVPHRCGSGAHDPSGGHSHLDPHEGSYGARL